MQSRCAGIWVPCGSAVEPSFQISYESPYDRGLRAWQPGWRHHAGLEFEDYFFKFISAPDWIRKIYLRERETSSLQVVVMAAGAILLNKLVISGDVCDIPIRSVNGTGTVRLLKTNRWRFHDLYIEKSGNNNVGLWASYMKDHPNASWWSIHGDEKFGAFCKGALIGAGMAR